MASTPQVGRLSTDRASVLELLTRFKARALHVGEVRGRLGLERDQHMALHMLLEAMAQEGLVTQLPGGRFRLNRAGRRPNTPKRAAAAGTPARKGRQERLGRLHLNPRGFGFVVTDEPGPDVFIPGPKLGGALHGDRVRVRAKRSDKGLDGQVLEVLERGMKYVGGQLHLGRRQATIDADDERLQMPVLVRGRVHKGAATGQGVIAKITRYPEAAGEPLEARIEELFEPGEFAEFEIRRILLQEGVDEEFDEEVRTEAVALPGSVPRGDKHDREDLRDIDLVTIDPDDARDHDDAVFAQRTKDGFRVIVAIADVSHYVAEGSAMDREALARGCTIYLPSRAIPMLPAELSSSLASLVPKRDRLCLAVEVHLGPSGGIRRYRFIEGVMRSRARLTYDGVARALGLTEAVPEQRAAQSRLPLLQALFDVAQLLGKRRRRRGALNFDLPEARVKLDPQGRPIDIVRSRKDPGIAQAYNLVEELMLLANEVVASDLSSRKLATIYRIHGPPDAERIEAFSEVARSLGYELDADAWQDPKQLSRFLSKVEQTPHSQTLGYLLLRAMQQATYDTNNVGHFGLGAREYLHFTSPIRRYPDLAVHRLVRRVARGERVHRKGLKETLQGQASEASRLERRAMQIERDVVDLYGAMLMQDRVGETFDATITGITEHGLFAALESPFVDVLCRLASLPPDHYERDSHGLRLVGQATGRHYALGQPIRVVIEDVSVTRRRISAIPVESRELGAGGQIPAREAPDKRRRRHTRQAQQRERNRSSQRRKRTEGPRKETRGRQPKRRRR